MPGEESSVYFQEFFWNERTTKMLWAPETGIRLKHVAAIWDLVSIEHIDGRIYFTVRIYFGQKDVYLFFKGHS